MHTVEMILLSLQSLIFHIKNFLIYLFIIIRLLEYHDMQASAGATMADNIPAISIVHNQCIPHN
jgi:hypothetical protein